MTTEILVCTTCQPLELSRDEPRQGQLFYELIRDESFTEDLPFVIRPVECMSGCSHACTIAFQARGKNKYFFGGLQPTAESVDQVFQCADLHNQDPNGVMEWSKRPPLFQKGLIARLPEALG
jgi:predicted metal-binding protein